MGLLSGENLDGKLTIERFLEFQSELQREILSLEFHRKDPDQQTGKISEKDFAELLLTYADYTSKKRAVVLKRVKRKYSSQEEDKELLEPSAAAATGITIEDYFDIFSILIHIDDLDKVTGETTKSPFARVKYNRLAFFSIWR